MRRGLAVPLLALLATGCSLAPKYYRPSVGAPPAWREPSPGEGSLADLAWWDLFGDPALQELIRIALAESQDIQLAVARIAEARARLGIVRSVQFPQVDAEASVARARFSDRSFPPLPLTADLDQTLYTTSLDLAFELDLWGRLRNATAAARAELLATEEARRTVMITLVSDVARPISIYESSISLARLRCVPGSRGARRCASSDCAPSTGWPPPWT